MADLLLAFVLAFHLFLPFGASEKINEIQDLKGADYKPISDPSRSLT